MNKLISLLLVFISFNCLAQYTITGKVISKTDQKPVASAVVFLSSTAIEGTTDNDGNFTLRNVSAGEYQVVVKLIGYDTYKFPVTVKSNINLADIQIATKNEVLNDVTIKAKKKLSPFYYSFEAAFFGSTAFARQCKILNPESILFTGSDTVGSFTARSKDFIEIENQALGYKIKFLLTYFIRNGLTRRTYFGGSSYFEEMKGSAADEETWRKNRLECYQGSVMQFLRAIIADDVRENGFRIKRVHREDNPFFNPNGLEVDPYNMATAINALGETDNMPYNDKIYNTLLSGKDILKKTNENGIFAMASDNSFYIEHRGSTIEYAGKKINSVSWIWQSTVSFITFKKPYAIFDYNGIILNPRSVVYTGFFSEEAGGIATLLPFDYKPV